MLLKFTKMHGAGNDFVMIDLITQRCRLRRRDLRKIAERRFGVGCDQILVVEPPRQPDVDFRYRIYNADGEEVEQCGNGARCFARFVRDKKLTTKRVIRVETAGGILELRVHGKGEVEVDMGAPVLTPADIPFQADAEALQYALQLDDQEHIIGAVSMGNPHAVLRVDDVATAPVATLGAALEQHPRFPRRVNVGFVQVISREQAALRVWERGVGETLACGTGACAAAVYGINQGWFDQDVTLSLPGGKLAITWPGPGHSVIMRGPTAVVFEGSIRI